MRPLCVLLISLVVTSIPFSAFAQKASLTGLVLAEHSELPLGNAEIGITSLNLATRSDGRGRFTVSGISEGIHEIFVRLVGFEPLKTHVRFQDKVVEADFLLSPSVTNLKEVDVRATVTANRAFAIKLAEFEERRALGQGRFLTGDDFEKAEGRTATTILLAKVPGLRVVQSNGRRWLASTRGGQSAVDRNRNMERIPPGCYLQVVVNGRVEFSGQQGQAMYDIDALNSKDIIGLEYYTVSSTPMQFLSTGASACGTVVIWTKGG
jgi:hypothetical protein